MDNELYRRVRALFATVLVLSFATLGIAALIGGNATVWVRGTIVAAIAAVLIALARRAFRGSRAAYLRMRLMSTAAPLAIVIIVALPHDGFPVWMKVEQAVVGVLLLAVAVMVGRKAVRQAYPKAGQQVR
ncbi:hypothetical protein NGB36_19850 [Streptomyces sp. RB6PN25]|uniref:Integral membrane protein n=1 Tax=Streptomyces humicola TaxID=2953240 RepID=A0ABT1PYR3_9ACTN|nr:hypothetical protein [Streptomyces humicola]MCQ4082797.1 hypothetical protein [Streptomyces humicola]